MPPDALAAPPTVLCEARHVTHEFRLPNGNLFRVLEDVNLAIRPREVVAILGPSGCGKSTVLRVLAGLIRPTGGEVLYHGAPLLGMSPGVAVVFQSFALFPWMTVRQNVEAALRSAGRSGAELRARSEAVIRLVALSGFEDVYPRELSGGMKQRVGIARALSVDPEILFMDEPFSQVDSLTAEALRAEVIDLWSRAECNPVSVVMVSHDIKEVVYMADRIVLMSARPGRVLAIVNNPLARPRDYRAPDFLRLVDHLHDWITGTAMPDAVPAGAQEEATEALPDVRPTEIVGLLEYLDARGGREDVFHIALDTHRDFGHLISVVQAAELLDLVDTPKRLVVLEPAGRRFLQATAAERTRLWREGILRLRLFRDLVGLLSRSATGTLSKDIVEEQIVFELPQEDYGRVFRTVVRWGRYGDLFAYDPHARRLSRKG